MSQFLPFVSTQVVVPHGPQLFLPFIFLVVRLGLFAHEGVPAPHLEFVVFQGRWDS